ncbi:MAG: helix-turn-helix transcriptional regulator [Coriobacteriales bacterium]|nr:helix-turn-helix transcriptional regulator [Coriobacteriales bacterium]
MPMSDRDRPLYMISVAAELTGMHPQTLRIYEAKGLVKPKRSAGNTRMYSQADIERLELVSQLTAEGINLAGVMRILDLKERLDAKEDEVAALRKQIASLEDKVHEYEMQKTITALARMDSTPALPKYPRGF